MPVQRREYRNAANRLLFAIDEAGFWDADAGSICALRGDVLELLRADVSMSAVRWGAAVSAVADRRTRSKSASMTARPSAMTSSYARTVSTPGCGPLFSDPPDGGRRCYRLPVGGS